MADSLVTTSIAGMVAAATEASITYPLEYLKTRQQLFRHLSPDSVFAMPTPSLKYYSGCSALIFGNTLKAAVRFNVYNWATGFMRDGSSDVSAPQIVVAGMITGFAESLVVVPFESIKTTMIDNSTGGLSATSAAPPKHSVEGSKLESPDATRKIRPKSVPQPSHPHQSKLLTLDSSIGGFRATVRHMYHTRGINAFVQGFNPTITRQVMNSAVRFTSYNFLKQAIQPNSAGEPLPSYITFIIGAGAGAAEVIATQPIDFIKTRMQSVNGKLLYHNSLMATYRIFLEEGVSTFWTGAGPRFIRVVFSGGIVFSVYEHVNNWLNMAANQNPFF